MELAIVIATFAGPIIAVIVTRYIDDSRQRHSRQMDVFRALMGSRKTPLSPDRVKALNMVEIEFYGIAPIQAAYTAIMAHINAVPTGAPDAWATTTNILMTRLLSAMAKTLKYNLQQIDVLQGGYYPQGFVDMETEQQEVRRALIKVLSGNRPLLVSPAAPTPPEPFPPPPNPS